MPKNTLRKDELAQWTHGKPSTISEILSEGFKLLREATTEKSGVQYKVDGRDVNASYEKVVVNILQKFAPTGEHRMAIPVPSKPAIDGSALLGAYFRSHLVGEDGERIIELNEQELQAVYDFVAPLVPLEPSGITPKMWLDSFVGSPKQNHKLVLKALIFQGVTEEEQRNMFKVKYKIDVESMLDSILEIADFMRTPFRVLNSEEAAVKAMAKAKAKAAHEEVRNTDVKTSGVDLQWSGMLNSFERSMDSVIAHKTKGPQRIEAEKVKGKIDDALKRCQGCFGVENASYQMKLEFAAETAKSNQIFKKILTVLGFSGEDAETALPAISSYVNAFRENIIQSNADKAEAIRAMSLTELIAAYATEWQAKYDELKKGVVVAQHEASELREQVVVGKSTIEQQTSQLSEIRHELETTKKQVSALETQLREAQEKAKLETGSLQQTIKEKGSDLVAAQQKVKTLEAQVRELTLKVQETEHQSQEQVRAAKQETSVLKEQLVASKLTVEQQTKELREIKLQLESSRNEVLSLRQQLLESQERAKQDTSKLNVESQRIIKEKDSALDAAQLKVHQLEEQLSSMTVKVQETERQSQQIKELLLRISTLEEQLSLAKQTQVKGPTVEALEEQLRTARLENQELLSRLELAQAHKEPVVVDHTQELEATRLENVQLKKQLELARQAKGSDVGLGHAAAVDEHAQTMASKIKEPVLVEDHSHELEAIRLENVQLKQQLELARQAKGSEVGLEHAAVVDEHAQVQVPKPLSAAIENKKIELYLALGGIKDTLKQENFNQIKKLITDSTSEPELEFAEHEIQSLNNINKFITTINEGILKRAGFFSSDPHKKTKAIENAFHELKPQEKIKLALLSEVEINRELDQKEKSPIGKFLDKIHHNRGITSIWGGEATSFTMFKTGISDLSKKIPEDVRNNRLELE